MHSKQLYEINSYEDKLASMLDLTTEALCPVFSNHVVTVEEGSLLHIDKGPKEDGRATSQMSLLWPRDNRRRFTGTAEKTRHRQGLESGSVVGTYDEEEGEDPLQWPGVRPPEVDPG